MGRQREEAYFYSSKIANGLQRFELVMYRDTSIYADVVFKKAPSKNIGWVCDRLSNVSKDFVPVHYNGGLEFLQEAKEDHRLVLKACSDSFMFDDMGDFGQFVDSVLYGNKIFSRWTKAAFFYFNPAEVWTAHSLNDEYRYVTVKSQEDLPFGNPQSDLEKVMTMQWLKDHLLFN